MKGPYIQKMRRAYAFRHKLFAVSTSLVYSAHLRSLLDLPEECWIRAFGAEKAQQCRLEMHEAYMRQCISEVRENRERTLAAIEDGRRRRFEQRLREQDAETPALRVLLSWE